MTTDELKILLTNINFEVSRGPNKAELPPGIDSFEKFLRKTQKLKDCIEAELDDRQQVDKVIGFFSDQKKPKYLQQDFYEPKLITPLRTSNKIDEPKIMSQQKPTPQLSVVSQPVRNPHFTTQQKIAPRSRIQAQQALKEEIDPGHILDDIQSNYNQSQANQTNFGLIGQAVPQQQLKSQIVPPLTRQHTVMDDRSDGQSLFGGRSRLHKKELADFMKEKLAKTRLDQQSLEVKKSPHEGSKKSNYKPVPAYMQIPKKSPSRSQLSVERKQSVERDEDQISLAEANSMLSRPIKPTENASNVQRGRSVIEEHKVIDTSKSQYKPLFNLPPKSVERESVASKKQLKTVEASKDVKLPAINNRKQSIQPQTVKAQKGEQLPKGLPKTQSQQSLHKQPPKPLKTPTRQKETEPEKPLSRHSQQSNKSRESNRRLTSMHEMLLQRAEEQGDLKPAVQDQNEQTAEFAQEIQVETVTVQLPKEKTPRMTNNKKPPPSPQKTQKQAPSVKQTDPVKKTVNAKSELTAKPESIKASQQKAQSQLSQLKSEPVVDVVSAKKNKDEVVIPVIPKEQIQLLQKPVAANTKEEETDDEGFYSFDSDPDHCLDQQAKSELLHKPPSLGHTEELMHTMQEIKMNLKEVQELDTGDLLHKRKQQLDQIQVDEKDGVSAQTKNAVVSKMKQVKTQEKQQVLSAEASAVQTQKSYKPTQLESIPEAQPRKTRNLPAQSFKSRQTSHAKVESQSQISDLDQRQSILQELQSEASRERLVPHKRRHLVVDEVKDYSHLYSSFYDIFAQHQVLGVKEFDMQMVREVRNMLATFVVLMHGIQIQIQTNQVDDIEQQAHMQLQLRDKFYSLKNRSENQVVKDCLRLQQTAPDQAAQLLFYRVIKQKSDLNELILSEFRNKSVVWSELPKGLDLKSTYSLLWSHMRAPSDLQRLLVFQRINGFTGDKNLLRKDYLKRALERCQKINPRTQSLFNFMPLTFILPKEYVDFLTVFSEIEEEVGERNNLWTMKAADKQRGQKLQLINDVTQIKYGEAYLMQQYIRKPLLVKGYKFDIRLYVLVSSVNPIEAFLFQEGFCQFGIRPYHKDGQEQIFSGQKVSFETLEEHLPQFKEKLWPRLRQTCIKALLVAQQEMQYNPCCFDLYGFDLLVDESWRPWLMEVTSSPSLNCDSQVEFLIKSKLISDSIDLLQPLVFDKKRLVEVLDRRLSENNQHDKNQAQKRQMNKDLTYILHGQTPRAYGDKPQNMGQFEQIAPSQESEDFLKMIGGQKMFSSPQKLTHKQVQEVKGIGSLPQPTAKTAVQPGVDGTPKRRQQPKQKA